MNRLIVILLISSTFLLPLAIQETESRIPELCYRKHHGFNYDTADCITLAAVKKNDIGICDRYQSPGFGEALDRCYMAISIKQNNMSICEKIDHEDVLEECLRYHSNSIQQQIG